MDLTVNNDRIRTVKAKDLLPGMVVVYKDQRHNFIVEDVAGTRLNEVRVSSNNDTSILFYDYDEMVSIGLPEACRVTTTKLRIKSVAKGAKYVYRGQVLIASILFKDDEWLVNWIGSGRLDRHTSLQEALDNVRKG